MLIVCDFDGTVTARDTNAYLARHFSPDASAAVAGRLAARELTVRQVIAAEFEPMTATLEEVVSCALEVPFRAGFHEFLDDADAAGAEVVLLSSGFRQIIEPMLEREGLAGRLPLWANDLALNGTNGTITWRDLPTCELCGEACKRHDLGVLRGRLASGEDEVAGPVVFVGDGFSDRCGADVADRIFARDSLAEWLTSQGIAWESWDDFHDVGRALGLGPSSTGPAAGATR